MPKNTHTQPSGQWNVYRRKEDADMWMRFEAECGREGIPPFRKLTELARGFVIRRSGI